MKKILFLRDLKTAALNQLSVKLEAEGFCVDHPQNGETRWLEDVKITEPDVVLMEVLPNNAWERRQLCKVLRHESETEAIPIILLGEAQSGGSERPQVDYLLDVLNAGANDYLQAPYELSEIIGKVNTAIRHTASMEKATILANQLNTVNEELYQRNIQIEKELHIARQLQQSLLPQVCPLPDDAVEAGPMFTKMHYIDSKLRISGIYLPCDALGGDLYDVLKFQDNAIGVSITDVSGHGVPAGFITAIFKTSLYRITHQLKNPSDVLYHLNNELFDIIKTGDYVTSLYLRIDMDTLALQCAGAGHPYPFFYKASENKIYRLQKNGTPLVWVKDIDYPEDGIQLESGDKVFLFTDGVSELKNPNNEMYGEERIEKILLQSIHSQSPYLTDDLIGDLSDYTEGAPLEDDISMVLIEAL